MTHDSAMDVYYMNSLCRTLNVMFLFLLRKRAGLLREVQKEVEQMG